MRGRATGLVFSAVLAVGCAALAACTQQQSAVGADDAGPSRTDASVATSTTDVAITPSPATPTSTTAPVTTVSTTSAPTDIPLSFAFSGDTLIHSPLWARARAVAAAEGSEGYDFSGMLAPLQPLVSAVDVAVCHLETPLVPEGEELSTFPRFGVPAEVAQAIAATGYDRCSTASNHTWDREAGGIDRTVSELAAVGVHQSGMARTPADLDDRFFMTKGVPIAHLSYTFSFNGLQLPEGEEWRSALIDPDRIIADATAAREAGAKVVVVSLHWGAEGSSLVTSSQRKVADAVTASGQVDLIVGHHAHMLQPIEQINGVWVVFGMGNILSNLNEGGGWTAGVHDGVVVTVGMTVSPDGVVTVDRPVAHPTYVDRWTGGGWVVQPVLERLADPTISAGLRRTLEASLERTTAILGDYLPG